MPAEADGIQVNFCKSPACDNYGIAPKSHVERGRGKKNQDTYIISAHGDRTPSISCQICGEEPRIKSNTAVAEEHARFLKELEVAPEPSCPDESCPNHSVPVGKGYQSIGLTHSGSRRYRCNLCKKTFSVGKSTTGQKQPHKNRLIFSLLMNKSPMRRVCEVADIDPKTLYGKIDFLYRQCLIGVQKSVSYDDVPLPSLTFKPMFIIDLFSLHNGSGAPKKEKGTYPYVAASFQNNGIVGYVNSAKYPGGWLSLVKDGDGGAGKCFYQPAPFWPSNHVIALEPKASGVAADALICVATLITHQCFPKYHRGYAVNAARLSRQKIMVPVISRANGEQVVDWDGMQRYGYALRMMVGRSMDAVLDGETTSFMPRRSEKGSALRTSF